MALSPNCLAFAALRVAMVPPLVPRGPAVHFDNKHRPRRSLSLPNLPPIAEEEESGKIAVREAILALRLTVNNVDQPLVPRGPAVHFFW